VRALLAGAKEVSYYPARHPWGGMWFRWAPAAIGPDMGRIASLGANIVRIFVQPASFGYPSPMPQYVDHLSRVVAIASAHGLRVHLTLFDLWHDYRDVTGSRQWAAAILSRFRGDRRIACVELQNEIDPTNPQAMAWTRAMLPAVRRDAGAPVTVSVTGWNTAAPLSRLIAGLRRVRPDFYDLHFYGTTPWMLPTFLAARRAAGHRPLLIGESGYSTATTTTKSLLNARLKSESAGEQAQASFISEVERAAQEAGLHHAGLWVLNDFPALPHVSLIERHFGLYRLNGTPKPAVAVVRAAFGATASRR
jgi:hypothetical protein